MDRRREEEGAFRSHRKVVLGLALLGLAGLVAGYRLLTHNLALDAAGLFWLAGSVLLVVAALLLTRSRRFATVVALHLLLGLLYFWATTERTPVVVVVSPYGYQVQVSDQVLWFGGRPAQGDRVGLFIGEYSRPYLPWGLAQGATGEWFRAAADWARQQMVETAWDDVRITADDQVVFHDRFESSSGPRWQEASGYWYVSGRGEYASREAGFSMLAIPMPTQYRLETTLVRGGAPAGILVAAADENNGLLLEIRPKNKDMLWWQLVNGQREGPLANGWFKKSLTSMVQDNLRLYLTGYGFALLSFLLMLSLYLLTKRWRDSRVGATRWVAPIAWPLVGAHVWPWAAVVVLVALASTGYIAYAVLERIPHVQDSVAYLFQAKTFALGRLYVPIPPLPQFFQHEFIVMYGGKWFSKYPPGHAALLALGVLAGQPWVVNPLAGALSLLVVYLTGQELYGRGVGLLAAALGLTSPFFLFMSGSFMAHPTGLLFVLLFTLFFVKTVRHGRWYFALAAGLSLGIAFLIRPWSAVAIGAPFVLAAALTLWHRPLQGLRNYAIMAVSFVPLVGLWLWYNGTLTGDPFLNPMELWWPFDKLGFGEGVGGHGPHTLADGLWNTWRNSTELTWHLFGWPPYLTLAFVLLPFGLLRANRWDLLWLSGWVSLMAAYVLWWAEGIMYGPRFYYESLGFLLLLTARGIVQVARLLPAIGGWLREGVPVSRSANGPSKAVVCSFIALLLAYNLGLYMPVQWSLYHGYNYVNATVVRAIERLGIHNALVFVETGEWWEWWEYGSVFSSNSPLLDTDVVYARDLGNEENVKLMALYPGRQYFTLRGGALAATSPSQGGEP